jgi:hypothetical protein
VRVSIRTAPKGDGAGVDDDADDRDAAVPGECAQGEGEEEGKEDFGAGNCRELNSALRSIIIFCRDAMEGAAASSPWMLTSLAGRERPDKEEEEDEKASIVA